MSVPVEIDRSRKSIVLVLVSYDPIKWEVTRKFGTEINQIILGGYGANKASVEVNGELYEDVIRRRDIPLVYKEQGDRFRSLVRDVPSSLEFERFDSFHGSYRAPEQGFYIRDVQPNNEALDSDYLRHKIEPINPNIDLKLSGVIAGQSGEFLPDGTFVKSLPLTPHFNLTVSSDNKIGYLYTHQGIRKIFAEKQARSDFELIPLPTKRGGPNRNLGHFKAIALDEKRNRLLAVFQAGAAHSVIMALDLETERWSDFGSTGRNEPHSLFYDAENDRFLLSVGNFSRGLSIGSLNPNSGQYQKLKDVPSIDLIGLTDLYDPGNTRPPYIYIAGMKGQHLALATDGENIFSRSRKSDAAKPFRRIYTYDLKTGEIKFTYYD